MAVIHLPTRLREYAEHATQLEANGETLNCLLESICTSYPALKTELFDTHTIKPCIRVFINQQDATDNLACVVQPSDTIHIIQAMAGG